MIFILDSGPINYLAQLGRVELLPSLFPQLAAPPAVLHELRAAQAPEPVRSFVLALPDWIQVITPQGLPPIQLGKGETEAIGLAMGITNSALLTDDLAASRLARSLGIPVQGTLGIVRAAHLRGMLDAYEAIEQLRGTNFRMTARLIAHVLDGL